MSTAGVLRDLPAAAARLRELHRAPGLLVLANCWDAASARIVERAGFPAVATTSAGVAASLGADDADVLDPDLAFGAVERIAAAVTVPVTADLEAGYGLAPDDLVARLLAAGAVGCNLEDTDHRRGGLVDAATHAGRIAAVKAAGRAAGVDIVVNARVDVFLSGSGDSADAVARGRRYLAAGADCVYPIMVADRAAIAALVEELGGPVNVLLGPGVPDLAVLRQLGVARASVGSGLFRQAMAEVTAAAERLAAEAAPPT